MHKSVDDAQMLDAAVQGVLCGINWGDTLEGFSYWRNVYFNLCALRDVDALTFTIPGWDLL